MAKILSSESITGPISKIFELPNQYVINGQIYNKSNLAPIPMQFAFYGTSTSSEMTLEKTAYHRATHSTAYRNNRGSLIDKNNPNIFYTIRSNISTVSSKYQVDYIKTDLSSNIPVVTKTSHNYDSNCKVSFIDEDDDFLYSIIQVNGVDARVVKTNKTNMTTANTYVIAINRIIEVIKITDMYIYLSVNGLSNTMQVLKYTKANSSVTILKDDTGIAGGFSAQCSIAVDPNNDNVFYVIRDGWMQDSVHRAVIKKYVIDPSNDNVDTSYVTMDMSGYTKGQMIEFYNSTGNQNDIKIIETNGTKYLVFIRYGESNNAQNSFMLVFEFTTSESVKLIQEVNFDNILFSMLLFLNQNKTIVIASAGVIRFYVWNSGSQRFELTSSSAKNIQMIGADIDENLFIQLADTSVEIVTNTISNQVVTKLEHEVYEYYGEDIAANLIAYAQNFEGKYVSTEIKITLIGPAVFTTSGEKNLTISTSSISANTIPITIIGSGRIKAFAELQ